MIAWLSIVSIVAGAGQRPEPPSSPAEEKALALSAAPEAMRDGAGLYLLGDAGYEQVRESENGLTCLVGRGENGAIEPICWDEEGTESILPVALERAALRAKGLTEGAIEAAIAEGFRTGRFRAPRRGGVAYMLSKKNVVWNGERLVNYLPHIMVYAPYVTNADIGSTGTDPWMPWVLNEGTPHAYIITVVRSDE